MRMVGIALRKRPPALQSAAAFFPPACLDIRGQLCYKRTDALPVAFAIFKGGPQRRCPWLIGSTGLFASCLAFVPEG